MTASRSPLLLLLLLVVAVAASPAHAVQTPSFINITSEAIRAQANKSTANPVLRCLDDLKRLCTTSTEDPWQCMIRRRDEVRDAVCLTWVDGLRACEADAQRKDGCLTQAHSYIAGLRRCIRTLDEASELSDTCRRSRFYTDLKTSRYRHLAADLDKNNNNNGSK